MNLFRTPLFFATLIAVGLVTGCQYPGPRRFDPNVPPAALMADQIDLVHFTNHLDPALLKLPDDPFTLGPGDHIEVDVMGEPGSAALLTVGPDGKIYYGMLPGLDVWGLTLEQTQQLIQKELGRYVRGTINVDIVLRGVESKKVWMLGRLAAPGVYSMSNSITLMEAIFNAGGPLNLLGASGSGGTRDVATIGMNEDLVDYKHSFVLRNGKMLPVDIGRLLKGDMSQNIYMHPDDYVYFAPGYSQEVHIFGAVGSPRTLPYRPGLTLLAAIADSGGTWTRDAYIRQVAIIRGSLNAPEIALIDLGKIERGEAKNVYLAPGDIVYVPQTPYKKIKQYWDILTSTFVSSVAINAGNRAVLQQQAQPTGVFIPFGSGITVTPTPPVTR